MHIELGELVQVGSGRDSHVCDRELSKRAGEINWNAETERLRAVYKAESFCVVDNYMTCNS